MIRFLAFLLSLTVLNVVMFFINKLFVSIEPYLFKLLLKRDLIRTPEQKEKDACQNKYTHWFWSVWFMLYYGVSSLNGFNFCLALVAGIVLYFIGREESTGLANISSEYRKRAEEGELNKFLDSLLLEKKKD